MKTERPQELHEAQQSSAADRRASAELLATVTVLVFVAITAGSVIFAMPQGVRSSGASQPIIENATASETPERPYHERYPVQTGGAQIDAPTF